MPGSHYQHLSDEAILRHVTIRRWSRVGMYLSLSASGFSSVLYPSLLVSDQVGKGTVVLLSAVVAGGGLVACGGSASDRWIVEFTILPILLSGLAVFGVSAILASQQQEAYPLLAYGLLLIAFSLGLFARWRDVRAVSRVHRAEINHENKAR